MLWFAGVVCLALSGLFFWAFYQRYLRWDFNELGRYYDAENQLVYTTSGLVWVLPASGLLAMALLLWGLPSLRGRSAEAAATDN